MSNTTINSIRNRFLMYHYPNLLNSNSEDMSRFIANETARIFDLHENIEDEADRVNIEFTPLDKLRSFIEGYDAIEGADFYRLSASLFGYNEEIRNLEHNSQVTSLYDIDSVGHYFRVLNDSKDFDSDDVNACGLLSATDDDHACLIHVETLHYYVNSNTTNVMDVMEEFGIDSSLSMTDADNLGFSLEYDIPPELDLTEANLLNIIGDINREAIDFNDEIVTRHIDDFMKRNSDGLVSSYIDDTGRVPLVSLTFRSIEDADKYTIDDLFTLAKAKMADNQAHTECADDIEALISLVNDSLHDDLRQRINEKIDQYTQRDNVVDIFQSHKKKTILYFK